MQQEGSLERFAPLSGVLFLVFIVIGPLILTGSTPNADDSTREVVDYWRDNDSEVIIGSIFGMLAAISLVWFGASLRVALRRAEGDPGRLSTLAFAGTLLVAVGGLLFSGLEFAAADTAGDVPPEVTQTLSVMDADVFYPLAGGLFVTLVATALVTLKHNALPRWLGWAAVVILVASLTPAGFIAFIAFLFWVALVGLSIYLTQSPPVQQAAPPAPPGA